MAKENLGVKRICDSCDGRFYDFNKAPITCPKCGHSVDPVELMAQAPMQANTKPASEMGAARAAAAAAGVGAKADAAVGETDEVGEADDAAEAEADEISLDALVEGENANMDDENVDAVDNVAAPLEEFGVDDVDVDDDEDIDDDVTLIEEEDS